MQLLRPDAQQAQIDDLEMQTLAEGFWDDSGRAQRTMTALAAAKEDVARAAEWRRLRRDAAAAVELAAEEEEVCRPHGGWRFVFGT